jgi:hypothetical protein
LPCPLLAFITLPRHGSRSFDCGKYRNNAAGISRIIGLWRLRDFLSRKIEPVGRAVLHLAVALRGGPLAPPLELGQPVGFNYWYRR